MKNFIITSFLLFGFFKILKAQNFEQFNIGICFAGFNRYMKDSSDCFLPATTLVRDNHNTSSLNICAQDGFNAYYEEQKEWESLEGVQRRINLARLNNMQVAFQSVHYFKPLNPDSNIYNRCGMTIGSCETPSLKNYFRPNYDNFIDDVFSSPLLSGNIFCHILAGEASYFHLYQHTLNCHSGNYGDSTFTNTEVPPLNVSLAFDYFRTRLNAKNITEQKFAIMEANHGKSINDNTIDGQGIWNPQDYIQQLSTDNVSFEGSYTQFPDDWLTQNFSNNYNHGAIPGDNFHYLSNFENIEFEKKYCGNVQDVIGIEGTTENANYWRHISSGTSSTLHAPNGNWLWFQTYTSIIHGVKGVWFYALPFAWNIGEETAKARFSNSNFFDSYDSDARFPLTYQNYLQYLAQELRVLVNQGLISNDPKSILATKLNHEDENCIVPPSIQYLGNLQLPEEKKTENYGLRYTIRTHNNKVIMIISNPLNIPISVNLDFQYFANPIVQNSTGVNVYFNDNTWQAWETLYKTNRNSNINLSTNTIGKTYPLSYSTGKTLPLSFGPLDVQIFEFNQGTRPSVNTDWQKVWTNNGDNHIGDWNLNRNDKITIGDFNNNGIEDILFINNENTPTGLASLIQTTGNSISTIWQNNSNGLIGPWIISSGDKFFPVKFISSSQIGLFCIQGENNGAKAMYLIYNVSANNWICQWSNFGVNNCNNHDLPGFIDGWSIKADDKFIIGDFDNDNLDELMCIQNSNINGWATLLRYNNNDFNWSWSNYGSGSIGNPNVQPLWNITSIDEYQIGDFDGDGKKNELFCVQKGGYCGSILYRDGLIWDSKYNNNCINGIAGWGNPVKVDDNILVGNLDNDTKEELMFIQSCNNCQYATTEDLVGSQLNWNWSNQNLPTPTDFIGDWDVKNTPLSKSRYYLINTQSTLSGIQPNLLLAIRDLGCKTSSLASLYIPSDPSTNKLIKPSGNLNEKIEIDYTGLNSNEIKIITKENNKISDFEIYDLSGKLVNYNSEINSKEGVFTLPNLTTGLYFIKIRDTKGNQRIIKYFKY